MKTKWVHAYGFAPPVRIIKHYPGKIALCRVYRPEGPVTKFLCLSSLRERGELYVPYSRTAQNSHRSQ